MTFQGKPSAANQLILWDGTKFVSGFITNANLDPTTTQITDAYVSATANISGSKIASATTGAVGVVKLAGDLGGTATLPSVLKINSTSVSASPSANQVLVATSGTASIWSQILDAYVSATAAIAGTKISPDFGSQNIVTTGSATVNDLTVNGTTTTVNSTVVNITDRVIHVNNSTGTVAVPSAITGISVHRGNTGSADRDHAGLFWDESNSRFNLAFNTEGNDSALGSDLPVKISGATLSGMTTGRVVTTSTGGLLVDTAVLSVSNLPSLAGDVSGTITANTVDKIHGASVPIAGSLTTGNVLQVNGSSSLTYAALNLAGGANFVTGTLPVGNLPSLSGDVSGTISANTVDKLKGKSLNSTLSSIGAAQDGYVLTWYNADAYWRASPATGGGGSSSLTVTTPSDANYQILVGDNIVAIPAITAARTYTLPASPTTGEQHVIKDATGKCFTYNVTITPTSGNIDNQTTFVMDANFQSVTCVYTGSQWSLV